MKGCWVFGRYLRLKTSVLILTVRKKLRSYILFVFFIVIFPLPTKCSDVFRMSSRSKIYLTFVQRVFLALTHCREKWKTGKDGYGGMVADISLS